MMLSKQMIIHSVARRLTSVTSATVTRRSYAASTTISAAFPAPRLFDYETVTANLSVNDAIESVEAAFGALAKGNVDVPMPMHIGIHETDAAGPGDCHISTFCTVHTHTHEQMVVLTPKYITLPFRFFFL
jgi:hypothetical protein